MHNIQQYILDKLVFAEYLRNRDMRPPRVESNLYQYHLLQLQKNGFVKKSGGLYTLSTKGLRYAGSHSTTLMKPRPQPTVLAMLLVVNQRGEVLIRTKQRQPFIGMRSVLVGKIHIDEKATDAAEREFGEKIPTQTSGLDFEYIGTAHTVIKKEECIVSDYIGIVCRVVAPNNFITPPDAEFVNPKIQISDLSPGIQQILDMYVSGDTYKESIIEMQ